VRRRDRLAQTGERLARWRAQHGGPGIPVPEALWAEAVDAARVAGVDATARALRLNRSRLAARMTTATVAGDDETSREGGGGFVELDAGRLVRPPRVMIRLEGRDGERLEVELGDWAAIDLAALAEAFWRRGR
jgi:hypothetical protein